ncbi:16S rRNA (adenine(1518)-N(6)/adenine(1519)-N(6))-dimethyltransferase RsmA [Myxococcota bacterium]|nr:16S rRNA (adenine(1518)-N(6)/adenine(1519)-N(6))-dimethyltransferase RsmA [Myxococcota bacterium]
MARAKRSLGQNFLVDPGVARRIVDAASIAPSDSVLEIGPGRGALTEILCHRAGRLLAIEKDDELFPALAARFAGDPKVTVVHGDALDYDLDGLLPGAPWKVIANLPYNVATPIALRLMARGDLFSDLVLMFQREVAARLAAAPGGGEYGIPSVIARVYSEPYLLFSVQPGSFRPVPKVVSTVVRFRVRREPLVPAEEIPAFERVVRCSFHGRRKTLLNSLATSELALDPGRVRSACARAGIDPGRRAETLAVLEFLALERAIGEVAGAEGDAPVRRARPGG